MSVSAADTPPSRNEMGPSAMAASARRIWGLIYRHIALYRTSWPRLLDLAYWPVLGMCIWGFTASFLTARLGGGAAIAASTLLGGVLMWEVCVRSQVGMTISFLEEIWSRNLGHVFVSPLRPWEMVAALIAMSVLRVVLGVTPAIVLAWYLFAFNLLQLGPVLALFFINLMIMGWAVALAVVSLVLRHGSGAEGLAWSVLFGVVPFCAVFYPVSMLPFSMRIVADAMPASHVFEGMRALMLNHVIDWDQLLWSFCLNIVWMIGAVLIFAWQFRQARTRGALLSIGE